MRTMPLCCTPARRANWPLRWTLLCGILLVCGGLLRLHSYVDVSTRGISDSYGRHLKSMEMTDAELDDKVAEALHRRSKDLKKEMKSVSDKLKSIKSMRKSEKQKIFEAQFTEKGKYQVNEAKEPYFLGPHAFRSEYDIPAFATFTRKSVLDSRVRLVKQPEVPLHMYTDLQDDLLEVIDEATKSVNRPDMEFVEGIYRLQHDAGTHYELLFGSTVNSSAALRLVSLFRPFARLDSVSVRSRDSAETVHIIVPLLGRGDSLRKFMQTFEQEGIVDDGHVHLTVVCYGKEALTDAKAVLKGVAARRNFKGYQIIDGGVVEFSRGRALQKGAGSITARDSLMFFCDVDMHFSARFLQQCRARTWPGQKVFYPMVFSLYNPDVVYKGKPVPSSKEQRVVRRDNGFWRDFGFGMTCQYKGDFDDIGGFDLTIKGWGSEDVLLYRKYSRSAKYQVIRNPVDTLFHHWHPKHCDKSLSLEQYNACLRSRSITEGSQVQLGMLYLAEKNDQS